jgi:hypothetical protein
MQQQDAGQKAEHKNREYAVGKPHLFRLPTSATAGLFLTGSSESTRWGINASVEIG